MTIKEIRLLSGLNRTKFCERYNLPYHVLMQWEKGYNLPPQELLDLIELRVRLNQCTHQYLSGHF